VPLTACTKFESRGLTGIYDALQRLPVTPSMAVSPPDIAQTSDGALEGSLTQTIPAEIALITGYVLSIAESTARGPGPSASSGSPLLFVFLILAALQRKLFHYLQRVAEHAGRGLRGASGGCVARRAVLSVLYPAYMLQSRPICTPQSGLVIAYWFGRKNRDS